MQMRLPIFPSSSRLINANTAVYADSNMVYYMHSGSVIYCHEKSDLQGYRYITANLVVSGLCRPKEIADTLGVGGYNAPNCATHFAPYSASHFAPNCATFHNE